MKYKAPVITEFGQDFDEKKIKKIALRKRLDPQDTEIRTDASVHGYGGMVVANSTAAATSSAAANSTAAANWAAAVNAVVYSNAAAITMVSLVAAVAAVWVAGPVFFPSKFVSPQITA
jgi:hypothetical protein